MLNKVKPLIVVIDSGLGGTSVLKNLIKKYSCGNYIYYADNANMPYGKKTKTYLKKHLIKLITNIKEKYNSDKIIIACNTASALLKDEVLPDVLLMPFNSKHTYLTTNLTKKLLPDVNCISLSRLAKQIEDNIHNLKKLNEIVKKTVQNYKLYEHNNLVLGCTHYELVAHLFKKFCPKTNILCNSDIFVNALELNPDEVNLTITIIQTKESLKYYEELFKLIKG